MSLLLPAIGISQQEYNSNDITQKENGLYTEKFYDEPITGKIYDYLDENQSFKKVYLGNLDNGKREGKWVFYFHSSGNKRYEYNYKEGLEDGIQTEWYKNGQKRVEWSWKDGESTESGNSWYENGDIRAKGNIKKGKVIWNEDGSVKTDRSLSK